MDNPIGFFDSGVGGTSIWKEVVQMLPNENMVYLADSKNAPYGIKPKEEIIQLSVKNTELLLSKNCKLIVVACNTATTTAISYLREKYSIPFIGIEPAIKPAALLTKTKKVGVLATKGTLSSALFNTTSKSYTDGIEVIEQDGDGLVELIEAGQTNSSDTTQLLKKYIAPMVKKGIDRLVLGCTHYPYLIPQLKEMLPEEIQIIDSGEAVAKQTKAVLEQNNLKTTHKAKGKTFFYTNKNVELLKHFISDEKNSTIAFLDF